MGTRVCVCMCVSTHQFDVVLWSEESKHGLQMLLYVAWYERTHKKVSEVTLYYGLKARFQYLPACLLRSCENREVEEGEEPFPRGKKRAAPLTVRKLSLMLGRGRERRLEITPR